MSNKKYGVELHPLHATWLSMKTRCYNPNHWAYDLYGGSGITVCDEWKHSFKTFCENMGDRPIGHTLDRIEGHLGYSKSNCKWSTKKEQSQNRQPWRKRNVVTVNGVVMGLYEAAGVLGIGINTAYREYRKSGDLAKYLK